MDDALLVNENEASSATDTIEDAVTRELVRFGLAEARMRVLKRVPHNEAQWKGALPSAPFDMLFLQRVLRSVFEQRDIVSALLAGAPLSVAAGWDGSAENEERT